MKREFLRELGLSDELIDKIMGENGKDIEKEKAKVLEKEKEIENLSSELGKLSEQVKSFEDMKIEDIKAKVQEFEEKYNQSQLELKESKENAILDKALSTYSAHDIDVVKGLIKKDQLVFKDDGVVGLEEQINKLREEKGFLFKTDEGDKKPQFSSSSKTGVEGGGAKPLTLGDAVYNELMGKGE